MTLQLFSYRSAPSAPSHVDLGTDSVNPSHPAYDVARALADGVVPIHEARIAMAMAIADEPLRGFRDIEKQSGITDDSILKVIPEAGEVTTLLSCSNRGRFATEVEDRRVMDLRLRPYRPPVGHYGSISSSTSNDQGFRSSNDLKDLEDLGKKTHGVRQMTGDVLDLLDPGLDLWNNPTEGYADRQEFGDAGWALAVVTGMQRAELTLAQVAEITRVGERQARRIIAKLEHWNWARRVREGRRVVVVVDFSMMAHEEIKSSYVKHVRASRKSRIHQVEGRVIKRLGSKIGWDMKEMWQSRKVEIQMLRDWMAETGSNCWDRLLRIFERKCTRWEGEEALYEYFRPYYPVVEAA